MDLLVLDVSLVKSSLRPWRRPWTGEMSLVEARKASTTTTFYLLVNMIKLVCSSVAIYKELSCNQYTISIPLLRS